MEKTKFESSITHYKCGKTSYNPNDVANLYCGYCHEFLLKGDYFRNYENSNLELNLSDNTMRSTPVKENFLVTIGFLVLCILTGFGIAGLLLRFLRN